MPLAVCKTLDIITLLTQLDNQRDKKRFKGEDCTPSSSSRLRFRDFFSYITHQSLSGLKDTHSSHP